MRKLDILYYQSFISEKLRASLIEEARPAFGIPHLLQVGESGGLENETSFKFLSELYQLVKVDLDKVLKKRILDRNFIDERTKALAVYNRDFKKDFLSHDYKTVLGLEDNEGRIVFGPKLKNYFEAAGEDVAPIPEHLQGNHVTLFGPPDSAKLCINAMNAWHRKLPDEPIVIKDLVESSSIVPKWGADDEDSKTPLREDLIESGKNLTSCFEHNISIDKYQLASDHLSHPIKRFPGLALPCFFLFDNESPIPLHLYDFVLHFVANWQNPKALTFYVPKLENEEEARYVRIMLHKAESMMKEIHPEYQIGTIRLMIVLENPRAVFRTNEIIDELYPYFVGASLGWHDFLASTARVFKEDSNYRIPVKADPDIVIKYIKQSHDLVTNVVGKRGGIKVGGMYGILSISSDVRSASYQVTLKGFIKDVVTQLKRGLTGFWVAHPDFVRLGIALVEAWKLHEAGNSKKLDRIVTSILEEKYHSAMLAFIHGEDVKDTFNKVDPLYARSLIVTDLRESSFIPNNHPEEIRYNVFQSLQYLTDWLSGNGCVALPALVEGVSVRVMDDLATAERSRWEVWHEIYHKRFPLEEFLKIAHEELNFIRKDRSNDKKIVQVKWDERTEKWYPVAFNILLKLMTDKSPAEFATELLLPFTVKSIRESVDPWKKAQELDPHKFALNDYVKRFNYYFEMCGSLWFAKTMAKSLVTDMDKAKALVLNFAKQDILEAAYFHGDIGESKKTLDKMASGEQARVLDGDEKVKQELRSLGLEYLKKFGMKFLISAQGKTGEDILSVLRSRLQNNFSQENRNACEALWAITEKRLKQHAFDSIETELNEIFKKHGLKDAQLSFITPTSIDHLSFGDKSLEAWFEMASLSKTVGSAFAIEYFKKKNISLSTSVDKLLSQTNSHFRLNDERVQISHLMNHSALNLHYVNGVPANRSMPKIHEFISGNKEYGYEPVKVINPPGEVFSYSGGGFLVLEHLIEALEGSSIQDLTRDFLDQLGMQGFSFHQENIKDIEYANGYSDDGKMIEGSRKMFPAFAAGAMGTSEAMLTFLTQLEKAYHNLDGAPGLSHDTARYMLHATDKGCMDFMGVKMGLGVFVGEAGENKFAIHQGANDGFRCIYLHCFAGPDRGKGFVSLCNGDLKGVLFNSEVTQYLLKKLQFTGIDFNQFQTSFSVESLKPEQIVNIGYKNLVFSAFTKSRPEEIDHKGPRDPLHKYNLCVGGTILAVSNEMFARAENLLSDHLPTFDPTLFGRQGKIMDSWETVRHNQAGQDTLIFDLIKPSTIRFVMLSTKFHTGNHAPFVKIEGLSESDWIEVLPKTPMIGHSENRIRLFSPTPKVSRIKVTIFPDGGFTRLGLYSELPIDTERTFDGISRHYSEKVPSTKKPMNLDCDFKEEEIKRNWKVKNQAIIDLASAGLGARVLSATDEHYSPAKLVLSPYSPLNMFDGMESARSRSPGHFDEVVIKLAGRGVISYIDLDFTYFVNNNPWNVEILGFDGATWETLVPSTWVKPFAGSKKRFEMNNRKIIESIRVKTIPDGGINRIHVMGQLK